MLTYLKLLMARSNELSWNGRNSSSATNLYVGTPGADWLVICDGESPLVSVAPLTTPRRRAHHKSCNRNLSPSPLNSRTHHCLLCHVKLVQCSNQIIWHEIGNVAPPTPHIQSKGEVTGYVRHTVNNVSSNLPSWDMLSHSRFNTTWHNFWISLDIAG